MDAFYVKGVVNFDFLFDTMTRNVCFCVRVQCDTPFLVRAKCIPQRMPFTTDVLNVSFFLC